jgi:hypothetical protein
VRLVFVKFFTAVDTDVPDPELPITDGLPLSFNAKDNAEQVGIRLLGLRPSSGHVV